MIITTIDYNIIVSDHRKHRCRGSIEYLTIVIPTIKINGDKKILYPTCMKLRAIIENKFAPPRTLALA